MAIQDYRILHMLLDEFRQQSYVKVTDLNQWGLQNAARIRKLFYSVAALAIGTVPIEIQSLIEAELSAELSRFADFAMTVVENVDGGWTNGDINFTDKGLANAVNRFSAGANRLFHILSEADDLAGAVGVSLMDALLAHEVGYDDTGYVYDYIALDDNAVCSPCMDAEANSPYIGGQGPMPGQVCLGGGNCRCYRIGRYAPEVAARLQSSEEVRVSRKTLEEIDRFRETLRQQLFEGG